MHRPLCATLLVLLAAPLAAGLAVDAEKDTGLETDPTDAAAGLAADLGVGAGGEEDAPPSEPDGAEGSQEANATADTSADADANTSADARTHVQAASQHGADIAVCPSLDATANGDGSVTLRTNGSAEAVTVLRGEAGGEPEPIATLEAGETIHTDVDTEAGVAYSYALAIDGQTCVVAEATSVPVFGSATAAGLAIGLSTVGYIALRRFG